LEDEETSKFIYDFVESHGGIEKATQELDKTKGSTIIWSVRSIFHFKRKLKVLWFFVGLQYLKLITKWKHKKVFYKI